MLQDVIVYVLYVGKDLVGLDPIYLKNPIACIKRLIWRLFRIARKPIRPIPI